jgi:predicted O-methyltransferase YrrM
MDEVSADILARDIELEAGNCWTVTIPELAPGDSLAHPAASRAELYEDGVLLGPAHAQHSDIRTIGSGLFSHWGTTLYFSSSDGSDPRTSGRRYTIKGPRRTGFIPHRSVIRGYEVVPSFLGQPLLDQQLLDEMETHHEAAGKSSWGTRNMLHALILSLRPRAVLEIGAHIGSASVIMASALKANGSGMLYCLEPQDHYYKLLSAFVERAGVSEFVTPLKLYSTSPELLPLLPKEIEIIYLDANHSYSSTLHDLEVCDWLLAKNGLILLDDVGAQVSPQLDEERRGGVRQALLDFTKHRPDLQVILFEPPTWLNPCGLGIVCKQSVR